jgi:hypothetical protein
MTSWTFSTSTGEFQHREEVHVARMHDIGDVAMDENIPGIEVQHVVGGDAAVGTAEPEITRRLLLRHADEECRIFLRLTLRPAHVAVQQVSQPHDASRRHG